MTCDQSTDVNLYMQILAWFTKIATPRRRFTFSLVITIFPSAPAHIPVPTHTLACWVWQLPGVAQHDAVAGCLGWALTALGMRLSLFVCLSIPPNLPLRDLMFASDSGSVPLMKVRHTHTHTHQSILEDVYTWKLVIKSNQLLLFDVKKSIFLPQPLCH